MEVYELIIAILKQAKKDYIKALYKNDNAAINELETFFLSDYGQAMSKNNGEKIIALCKKIAEGKCGEKRVKPLIYKGEVKSYNEWARITGLSSYILRNRIRRGWSAEKALTTPKIERDQKK